MVVIADEEQYRYHDNQALEKLLVHGVHSDDQQDGHGQQGRCVEAYGEGVLADDHVDAGRDALGPILRRLLRDHRLAKV